MKNLKKLSRIELKGLKGGLVLADCVSNAGCGSGQICVTCSGSNCGSLGSGFCI